MKRSLPTLIAAIAILACCSVATFAQNAVAPPKALEFSEQIVAGSDKDFMIVRHLEMHGSQREIGKKLAQIAIKRHGVRLPKSGNVDSNARLTFFKENYPSHHARSLGVADAFGVAANGPFDITSLPYNSPNLGCSVVFYPKAETASGHSMLSRNYDFTTGSWTEIMGQGYSDSKPATADPYILETYPDQGIPSLVVCAYELLGGGLDGINAKGLTVALLQDEDKQAPQPLMKIKPGLGELELVRFLLENCGTVEEARDKLETIDFYYSVVHCHYMIGDRAGNSFVWEYSADRKHRFAIERQRAVQCVTNHALHEEGGLAEQSIAGSSARRLSTLRQATRKVRKHTRANIVQANQLVSDHKGSQSRTLWHSLYDCQENSLEIDFYLGETSLSERRSGYIKFQLNDD